jgi:hypothetical protein
VKTKISVTFKWVDNTMSFMGLQFQVTTTLGHGYRFRVAYCGDGYWEGVGNTVKYSDTYRSVEECKSAAERYALDKLNNAIKENELFTAVVR